MTRPAYTAEIGALPDGMLACYAVATLPTLHSRATIDRAALHIRYTPIDGFYFFGQYATGFPNKPLRAVFSLMIDNNSADDANIVILDVYDHQQDRVLGKMVITRKDFAASDRYCLFYFDFTPPASANMEFRAYYMGGATIWADKIAVCDPAVLTIDAPEQLPTVTLIQGAIPEPETPEEPTEPETPETSGLLTLAPCAQAAIAATGGTLINSGGTFDATGYRPSWRGGVAYNLTINLAQTTRIAVTIDGGWAGWNLPETPQGGNQALWELTGLDSPFHLSFQRMDGEYRGGGVFRVFLADNPDVLGGGTAWLITIAELAGAYSMRDWGAEAHELTVALTGNTIRLTIDGREFRPASTSYAMTGTRRCRFVLGNFRESVINLERGAQTHITAVRVTTA